MNLLVLAFALIVAAQVVVVVELARTVVARVAKLRLQRRLGFASMEGPGCRWKWLATIAVGPVAAYLGVAAIAFTLYTCEGIATPGGRIRVGEVQPGFDAAGKLEPGDTILAAADTPVFDGGTPLVELVNRGKGAPVTLRVEHRGKTRDVTIQPRRAEVGGGETWRLGIVMSRETARDRSIGTALPRALEYPVAQIGATARGLPEILFGREEADPGGPVRIVVEYRRALEEPDSFAFEVLKSAMVLGAWVLLGVVLLDVMRVLLLVLRRRPSAA